MADEPKRGQLIRFPRERAGEQDARPRRDLGTTPMVRALGWDEAAQFGHWCRRCEGIWWGMPLEAQCPVCGHRGP